MSVDRGVLEEYLSQRLPRMRCPACGERAWDVPQPDSMRILLETSVADPDAARPVHPYLPALRVSCSACGHILLFAQSAIASWWHDTLQRRSREEGWEED